MRFALVSSLAAALVACSPPPPPAGVAAGAPSASVAAPPPGRAAVPVVAKVDVSAATTALVAAADRTDDDRALDGGRHPAEMLAYFGVAPGMKVADLAAGGGYTTELLARAVGPTGVVYGQNSKFILERFAEKAWSERLARPINKVVVRTDRELDDPLPPEAKGLDAVFLVLFYHDTFWLDVDRSRMNKAVFAALEPGGIFAIVDHSAAAGVGASAVKTLHRIEETIVRDEVTAAGFVLESEAAFLRNPTDKRDWNDSPSAAGDKRGTSDRFVYRFVKPR